MLYYWLLFFFLVFGAKVVLALAMVYLLLPDDRRCTQCDEETLLLRASRAEKSWTWVFRGRVQRRWCPACGWEGLARRHADPPTPREASVPTPTWTPH